MPFKARSNDQNKVIVIGIAKSLDDAGLSDMFGLHGTVADAKVVLDDKKQSRGFGFVTYASAAAKNKAIKHMNESSVDGRVLTVRDVIPKADRDGYDAKKDEKQKVGVCWAFQKGLCDKGDACKYPHEAKDGDYGSCFEFVQSGKCKRGDECKFAHTGGAKSTDSSSQVGDKKASVGDPSDGKPRVCFAFQNGKCHRGKACMFVHSHLEDPAKDGQPDSKKRKRDDNNPKERLAALVAAEDKARKVYEAAKKERQELERQLDVTPLLPAKKTGVKANDQSTNNEISLESDQNVKVEVKIKAERGQKAKVALAPAVEKLTKIVTHEKGTPHAATLRHPKVVAEHDNEADSDDDDPPVKQAAFDDDDDDDGPLSFVIQNAINSMKKVDEDLAEPEVPAAKPIKPVKTAPKAVKYVAAPLDDDVDMGAAFDDGPPPKKKKSKPDDSRLKASDHRRLRQQQKKEALQRLKAKKEIAV
ncbi:hypothetical protein AaE_014081 [Aphanomyces astaci]|uniref:Zinc finger CCCH domain-containing protein 42 n=1 Tax=Aphanomyces astaci TaxID=112090 RepID=A0A6A4ZGG1_APHAT|nr:hypothetical protein AaE_014081 [Aphanomyces astaci]